MAVDLNDESTWDVDDAELLAMATTGVVPTVDPPEVAAPEPTPEPVAEEPPKLRPLTPEPKDADILAADGKNLIPHGVLKQTREDLHTARALLEQANAELAALRQPAAAVVAAAPVASAVIPDEVKQRIEKIKENWGDDIAQQAEQTYWLQQQTLRQQQTIDQLAQYIQDQQRNTQLSEADTINDAIDSSPKLSAWANAEDQSWFDRSTALHATLRDVDPAYAALSWYDKMKMLPEKVEALFGASFEPVTKVDTSGVRAKVQAVLDAPPSSLSELSGGTTPERGELEKIEDLKGNELNAFMYKLSADPKKFEAYLRSMS